MKFYFDCCVRSDDLKRTLETWQKDLEAPNEIDAMLLARSMKSEWDGKQKYPENFSIRMTLHSESNKKPFWISERGRLQKQSDSS